MDESYKCPVCGSSGLRNYKKEHIICPQCDTDLKPYMLLSNLLKKNRNSYVVSSALIILTILIIILGTFLLNENNNGNSLKATVPVDTVKYYNNQIKKLETALDNSSKKSKIITINYTIRSGDNLTGIAESFYNNWRKYKLIAQRNNIHPPYILKPGQKIKIKLVK